MSDDVLVRVENVSKRFCRSLKRSLWYGLQDLGSELGGRRHGGGGGLPQSSADVELRKDEFWAVKDVSFELRRGECLGLIGRNGAGKTTLLRMLNGLIKPDTGRIEMQGRVGALIALGAGFNPVLTGRENIYNNASILGITKSEVKSKLDEIIDFSGIDDFIDMPVQSYSSGMQVRLGFAVASSLKPDILIIDEVLAVGDNGFRVKCFERISRIKKECAIIFVSHQMIQIGKICTRGIVLERGRKSTLHNDIQDSISTYNSLFPVESQSHLFGNISRIQCELSKDGPTNKTKTFYHGERLSLKLLIESECKMRCEILLTFSDSEDRSITQACSSTGQGEPIMLNPGENQILATIKHIPLAVGTYPLSVSIFSIDAGQVFNGKPEAVIKNIMSISVGKSATPARCPVQLTAIWQAVPQAIC